MTKTEVSISDILQNTLRMQALCISLKNTFGRKGYAPGMVQAILDLMTSEIEEARAALKVAEKERR